LRDGARHIVGEPVLCLAQFSHVSDLGQIAVQKSLPALINDDIVIVLGHYFSLTHLIEAVRRQVTPGTATRESHKVGSIEVRRPAVAMFTPSSPTKFVHCGERYIQ